MKKIGFRETFIMYVNIDHKRSDEMVKELKKAGFRPKVKDLGNDHEISINVTPGAVVEPLAIMDAYV